MGSFLILSNTKPSPSFTWNPRWIAPYESPWGIFEKFKYANETKSIDLLHLFGTDELKSKKNIANSNINCNLIHMDRLNGDIIKQVLGLNLKEINTRYFVELISIVSGLDLFNHNLKYCKICLSNGYHSILHQLKIISHCPFHPSSCLSEKCAKCKRYYPYRLSDEVVGFQCKCGHQYFSKKYQFNRLWLRHKPSVRSEMVQSWINLDSMQREELKSIVTTEDKMPWLKGTEIMDCLLKAVTPRYKTCSEMKHFVVKSSAILMQQGNLKMDIHDDPYMKDHRVGQMMDELKEDIFRSTAKTFSAIDKHIRKTFLLGHKSCVKRIGFDEKYCSYAFVYTFWKQFIEELSHYRAVSYGYRRKRPSPRYDNDFVSKYDAFVLQNILWKWNSSSKQDQFIGIEAKKWVVNRVMYHMVMNHLYNWIRFVKVKESKDDWELERYKYQPFGYLNMPFFVIKPPSSYSSHIEFHWFTNNPISLDKVNLRCPFDTVEKRRKRRNYIDLNL
jgi:hypothetical protein